MDMGKRERERADAFFLKIALLLRGLCVFIF
jgi:hypothetical protein